MLPDERTHIENMARFVQLPAIRPLAEEGRWTVSDSDKMPIDVWALEHQGIVAGCRRDVPGSTTTLDKLAALLPNAANFAFYLDSDEDGLCVLDIEPYCPDDVKQAFLEAPCLYAERSMSGKGYHLLLPYPNELMRRYPGAAQKKSVKDAKDGWEVLFEHWVTFTGNTVDTHPTPDGAAFLEQRLSSLFAMQRELSYGEVDVSDERPDDIPYADALARAMLAFELPLWLTPEKYSGDMSTYEFATAMQLLRALRNAQASLAETRADAPVWTEEQTVWLLYESLANTLPHRDKHDCTRKGLPWLLYLATRAVGAESAEDREDA